MGFNFRVTVGKSWPGRKGRTVIIGYRYRYTSVSYDESTAFDRFLNNINPGIL